jgi:hypothetical protein
VAENGEFSEAAGSERRRSKRYEVTEAGTLWHYGNPTNCLVKDVSADGALVETGLNLPAGADVELEVPRWGRFAARVVRTERNRAGLAFTVELSGLGEDLPPSAPDKS